MARARQSLPKAIERIGGIQAQYAPAMYVGLWSRLEGFEREKLTRALERRSVVQGTALRATIHLLTPPDWWTFAAATRTTRRDHWLRAHRGEPSAKQMAAAARRVRRRLAEGPVAREELQQLIGMGPQGISGINLWVDLVRAPPSGTWDRRRADLFADAELWLGAAPEVGAGDAATELVRSYLRGFGPASTNEIASWAGVNVRTIVEALRPLELRRFRAEDGAELLDLPRLALPDPEIPAPSRLLPVWDATLLVHARRSQILPEQHRPKVFNTKTPHSVAPFTVDGQVAGTWRLDRGRIALAPFGRLARADRRELAAEAERLAELYA